MDINWRHITRWDGRLELLAQGAPIDVHGAPTTPNYMSWFLSITRRWMTPRAIFAAAAHYAPAAPTMTQFAQEATAVMRYRHKEPVREIAHGMLVGSQFQHFTLEVAVESSPTTTHTHVSSSAYDYHLEEMDHSYPVDVAGTSQAGPLQLSQYQSPPLPEQHPNASYYSRRRRKPTQLDRVDEGRER
ncbi:uncharacterized protein LOC130808544 [Amaranthus tricolor]|uniref:uncharacterized protein LOC130808544 n=1 Tax=Amaranthus tricolor TaxID=29722 RepID=UPI0025829085|nr:uncharacterized protein LOC130808544 [Amaranthus tricolor]